MRAGALDRKVTLERRQVETSASGVAAEHWYRLAGPVWADVRPLRSHEVRGPVPGIEQVSAHDELAVEIRWSPAVSGVNAKDRVVDGASVMDILAVHEIGRREGLKLIVRRRAD